MLKVPYVGLQRNRTATLFLRRLLQEYRERRYQWAAFLLPFESTRIETVIQWFVRIANHRHRRKPDGHTRILLNAFHARAHAQWPLFISSDTASTAYVTSGRTFWLTRQVPPQGMFWPMSNENMPTWTVTWLCFHVVLLVSILYTWWKQIFVNYFG